MRNYFGVAIGVTIMFIIKQRFVALYIYLALTLIGSTPIFLEQIGITDLDINSGFNFFEKITFYIRGFSGAIFIVGMFLNYLLLDGDDK